MSIQVHVVWIALGQTRWPWRITSQTFEGADAHIDKLAKRYIGRTGTHGDNPERNASYLEWNQVASQTSESAVYGKAAESLYHDVYLCQVVICNE
jgi:hypothetical protein